MYNDVGPILSTQGDLHDWRYDRHHYGDGYSQVLAVVRQRQRVVPRTRRDHADLLLGLRSENEAEFYTSVCRIQCK